jgi:hypothetical protein
LNVRSVGITNSWGWVSLSSDDPIADFAPSLDTGMRRVSDGVESYVEIVERLRDLFDEFDTVRIRGEVESRFFGIGNV